MRPRLLTFSGCAPAAELPRFAAATEMQAWQNIAARVATGPEGKADKSGPEIAMQGFQGDEKGAGVCAVALADPAFTAAAALPRSSVEAGLRAGAASR